MLNDQQLAAVHAPERRVLVVAGAGCGKTMALAYRAAHLVEEGVSPSAILAMTYTRRAAAEMAERIAGLIGPGPAGQLWMGTIHSICFRVISQWGQALGYDDAPSVYGPAEADSVKEGVIGDLRIRCSVRQFNEALKEGTADTALRRGCDEYRRRLKVAGAIDYDGLVAVALELLSKPDVAAYYQSQFSHLLVDETQDLAEGTWRVVDAMAGGSVWAVGDDSQCHPAGTMVQILRKKGSRWGKAVTDELPIENIRAGDYVSSFDGESGRARLSSRVLKVGARKSREPIYRVILVGGRSVEMTAWHRVSARWDRAKTDLYCVYLMYRQDRGFRVGMCQLLGRDQHQRVNRFYMRCRFECAESGWVLSVLQNRQEAAVQEAVMAAQYGLPSSVFRPSHGCRLTDDDLGRIFAMVDTESRGRRLLKDFDLRDDLPHYSKGEHAGQKRFVTVASHLRVGMALPIPGKDITAKLPYVPIERIERWCPGQDIDLYSLEVERDHSYFANGIGVLNSIFSFLGANLDRFLGCEKAGWKVFPLTQNYRCTKPILALGNAVLERNIQRIPKILVTEKEGSPVVAHGFPDDGAEIAWIAEEIRRTCTPHAVEEVLGPVTPSWNQVAILCRTNAFVERAVEGLTMAEIPVQAVGAVDPFTTATGRLVIDIFRLAVNPRDDMTVRRVLQQAGSTQQRISLADDRRLKEGLSLYDAARTLPHSDPGRRCLEAVAGLILPTMSQQPRAAVRYVIECLRRVPQLQVLGDSIVAVPIFRAVDDWQMRGGDSLADFLLWTATKSAIDLWDEAEDAVAVMTVHAAKGLEFPVVFVPGWEEGVLPHIAARSSPGEMEEERRIAHVAVTRAAERLYVTWCDERAEWGRLWRRQRSHLLESLQPQGASVGEP